MKNKNILFVGFGNMGKAVFNRIYPNLKNNNNFFVKTPTIKIAPEGVKFVQNLHDHSFDIIILCVKPQKITEIISDYKIFNNAIFISILAGKKISFFEKNLAKTTKIIRTMPNLPVSIGKGVIISRANNNVLQTDYDDCSNYLFDPLGYHIKAKHEDEINKVTSIAGSGPAYFYLFMQALQEAAEELDLKNAKDIALYTAMGSCLYAEQKGLDFNTLKQNVTSKGGTTEAALKIFEKNDILKNTAKNAVKAALERSEEL